MLSFTTLPTLLVPSPTTLALLVVLPILYYISLPKPIPGIPYNRLATLTPLGDLPFLLLHLRKANDPWPWMTSQCIAHDSPLVQVFVKPFSRPFVILADYREAEDVLRNRTPREFDRASFFKVIFGGIFPEWHLMELSHTEKFKLQKKLVNDTMNPVFLANVAAPRLGNAVAQLIELWKVKTKVADGASFEAAKDLHRTIFDSIWGVATGEEANAINLQRDNLDNKQSAAVKSRKILNDGQIVEFEKVSDPPIFSAVHDILCSMLGMDSSPAPRLHHWVLRHFTSLGAAFALKDKILEDRIAASRRDPPDEQSKNSSALDWVVRRAIAHEIKIGQAVDDELIKGEMLGWVAAGHETTATSLSWMIKHLTSYPDVQSMIRKSLLVHPVLGQTRSPAVSTIDSLSLPYVDAFIEESLRLGQPLPFIGREAVEDSLLLGSVVPKGTILFCLPCGPSIVQPAIEVDEGLRGDGARSGRDRTRNWKKDDVGEFRLERWLRKTGRAAENGGDEVEFDMKAGPTMPFGQGIRGCFGKKLAYMQLRVAVVMLVLNFELQSTPAEVSSMTANCVSARQPDDCFVRLKPL